LALGPDGGLVAAWQNPWFSTAVRAFTPAGHPLLPEASEANASGSPAYLPQVASLGTGRSVVVWTEPGPSLTLPVVLTRLIDASGQPIGAASLIGNGSEPAVAGLPSGEHVVVWRSAFGPVVARRFNAATPLSGEIVIASASGATVDVAARPDNGFVATWQFGGAIFFRVYGPGGEPLTGPIQANVPGEGSHQHPQISTDAAGRIFVAWHLTRLPADDRILVRRFSPLGEPLGAAFRIHEARNIGPIDVAARPDGSFLTLFTEADDVDEEIALARVFDVQGAPVGDAFQVHDTPPLALAGNVAADESGWVVSWRTSEGTFLRRLATTCGTLTPDLCLNGGRFRVEIAWHVPATGARGTGHPLFLSGDTGAFWFFDPSNPELLVKVLDGRSLNGHFWVFFGALTNVEYDLTVTDNETGAQKTWHNPAGTMASRADIRAFPDAGSTPASAAVLSSLAPDGTTSLSLSEGADVSVEWRDPATGELKSAGGAPLSRDSASFWFFGDENVELIVKVLDGRAINGHIWVFYGALTDLEYTLTVTLDGETRTYHNPRGRMASAADTRAF
jgi:hypothetical protein